MEKAQIIQLILIMTGLITQIILSFIFHKPILGLIISITLIMTGLFVSLNILNKKYLKKIK
jgi:hypothetical protein